MDIMWLKQAVLNASFPGPGAVYGVRSLMNILRPIESADRKV